mgnify:CR=1 FL=1
MWKRIILTGFLSLAAVAGLGGCQAGAPGTKGGETYMNQQLVEPQGPTAVIQTSMGDITVAFFPQQAPKAVENFLTHARDGYYDGLTFHRVINDFMIQGGSKDGTGSGGESIWGHSFEDEFSDDLHHFPGALSMANSGMNTNGSQFFIVQNADPVTAETAAALPLQWYVKILQRQLDQAALSGSSEADLNTLAQDLNGKLRDIQANGMPEDLAQRFAPALEKYQQVGGTYHLDYKHTVFGQVIAGMDVVDAIAKVDTDADDKPVKDVTILKVTVSE